MENEKKRLIYYKDNMTKSQHMLAYAVFAIIIAAIFYIYYHLIIISIIGGMLFAVIEERRYSKRVIKKRQDKLRIQFKEFLDIITVSISGGSGQSMENAIRDAQRELRMLFNAEADIIREIELIVSDFDHAGIPMKDSFKELGERSNIDDIASFATIYATIDGKTSDFGYIVTQTRDIIKDKVEISMEIETTITSAKSETTMMLILPLLLIIVMSVMGSGFLDALFTTAVGRAAATFGLACTLVSYEIASKATDIEV